MRQSKYMALPEEVRKQIVEFDSKYCNGEIFAIEYDNCEGYSDNIHYMLDSYFNSYRRAVDYILNMEGLNFTPRMTTWGGKTVIQFIAKYDEWSECSYSVKVLTPA